MGRDRSRSTSLSRSDDDDYRSSRRSRDDSHRRRDHRESDRDRDRDRDRERKRRSRSRSTSPRHHRRGAATGHRRRGSSRDSRYGTEYKDSSILLRPTTATHFGQPNIDAQDFENWVQLLNKCDQKDDIEYGREKYDEFLAKYPYCYGFWTKYAEYERKNGSLATSKEIWERGIITIPLSIDLWLGYISQMKLIVDFPSSKIRELYDRALDIAGLEFQSDRLWLDAIGFERSEYIHDMCSGNTNANCRKIGEIFDKLLGTPTMHAATHLERYIAYINTIEPNLLLSEEEYDEIFKMARKFVQNKGIDELVNSVQQKYIVKSIGPKGELNIVAEPDEETFEVTVVRVQHDPELLQLMRAEIVSRRRVIFEKNMKECEKRALFEANIKRPYFHVKPLDNPQLFNWLSYLDFEINIGDEQRIRVLFERCLIACALYEEFWTKYARWAWRAKKSKSTVRDIYRRAKVHIPNSLNLVLSHAGFEESIENFGDAISLLDNFRHTFPGYVLLELRYLGVLRRKAEKEGGGAYEYVLTQYENLVKSSEYSPSLATFYSLKLSRFHQKFRRDSKMAQKVIKKALTWDPLSIHLYTQLVDVAYTSQEMSEHDVIQAFDIALESELRLEDKIKFSQRKLDFLEELGKDISAIEDHRDYHYNLLGQLPDNATIRTRFAKEPTRIAFMPPVQQQMGWAPQMQHVSPMNMVPMIPMQQAPPVFMQQPPQMPAVQLTMIEPGVPQMSNQSPMMGSGDGSGTPLES